MRLHQRVERSVIESSERVEELNSFASIKDRKWIHQILGRIEICLKRSIARCAWLGALDERGLCAP